MLLGTPGSVPPGGITPGGTPGHKGPNPKFLVAGGAVAVVVVLVIVVVTVAGVGKSGGGRWPNETGYSEYQDLQAGPTAEPEKAAWTKSCDGTCSLAADADRVFVLDSDDRDQSLSALKKSDGEKAWNKTQSIDGDSASIAWAGGLVVVDYSGDGQSGSAAHDPESGDRLWNKDDWGWTHFSSGSYLALSEGDSSGDTETTIIDARSGDKKWSKSGTIVGICGTHVVLRDDDSVKTYSLSSGSDQGRIPIDSDDYRDARRSNDGVFIVGDDGVMAYSFTDGKKRWKSAVRISDANYVTAGAGLVFVYKPKSIRALVASSGDEQWRYKSSSVDDDSSFHASALPGPSGTVLVGDVKKITLFSEQGDELGSYHSDSEDAVIASNGLYDVDGDNVSFVDMRELDKEWTADTDVDKDDGIDDSAVGGGRLYVSGGGDIMAYA